MPETPKPPKTTEASEAPDPAQKFDRAMSVWKEWQEAPWGRLRYAIAEANLVRHCEALSDGPLRVLDLAGGDGGDAVRLAARGHHVTIVDLAPAMLEAAAGRAREAGLADLVDCVEADVDRLPAGLAGGGFDVVLCHNLLAYADDARHTLGAALAPLRPDGLFSVMALNRHSQPLTVAVRETDLPAAVAALDSDRAGTRMFGSTLTLHTAEEVTRHLTGLGCRDVRHYGVRSVCDHLVDDARKYEPAFYAELERLELALTDRHPYMHTARLFQLIARKDG
ncbi:class I SAM-dependent methyltransferase [Streptomyces filamentosus]|uniref:class I SAM-dependent methyltransferase n=1 Tax=Streptomyces filamentosus TaxID=67294 RepID=UPI001F251F90|nr:methyltransferase domain-containing protein [Streptomyces filamentosus]